MVHGTRSQLYFSDYVKKGETFTIDREGEVDSVMWVYIYDTNGGAILQTFSFDSSCSKKLHLNDIFGGMTIGKCTVHEM